MTNERFSECWQFLADYPGTSEQRGAVLHAFHLVYGDNKWKFFKRLDYSINSKGRSYLTFGFVPDDWFPPNMSAVASVAGINMRESYHPDYVEGQALHELTHVADKHFMTARQRLWFMERAGIDTEINTWNNNVQETFADAGRDCFKGEAWQSLWSVLLGEI